MSDAAAHAARSAETLAVVQGMGEALRRAASNMEDYFHADFVWRGNVGCGTKRSLAEFRRNWQWPLRAIFHDRTYETEQTLSDGDWAACFGVLEGTHAAPFMGIPATGRRIRIPYMDFWQVEDGRIKDNPVNVDFAAVLLQLGRDVFDGEGWEHYDSEARPAPTPDGEEARLPEGRVPAHPTSEREWPADAEGHAARSAETLRIVRDMEDGLGRAYNDTYLHFHEDFTWRGNVGCGTKHGLAEFRRNWQMPIRASFKDRTYTTEKFIADGDWAACFGILEGTHHGPFMGIAPTGKRVKMPYMDFWRVTQRRIKDNPVFVDFPAVLQQLGRDAFKGEGWEHFDSGEKTPPGGQPA